MSRHRHSRAQTECENCDEWTPARPRHSRRGEQGLGASLVRLVWDFTVLVVCMLGVALVALVQVSTWVLSVLVALVLGRKPHGLPPVLPVAPIQLPRAPRRPSVGAATAKGAADSAAGPQPVQVVRPPQPVATAPDGERERLIQGFIKEHKFPRALAETVVDRHLASQAAAQTA